MPITRPSECPECGHDGITRSSPSVAAAARGARDATQSWTCRLCDYSWILRSSAPVYEDADSPRP